MTEVLLDYLWKIIYLLYYTIKYRMFIAYYIDIALAACAMVPVSTTMETALVCQSLPVDKNLINSTAYIQSCTSALLWVWKMAENI